MFLELTEILRCPAPHDESYVICAPVLMDGRDVVRGGLACPVCRAEYAIIERVAWLAPPEERVTGADPSAAPSALTAEAVRTFLDLQGQGGFVVTVGTAGRIGRDLAALLPGVSFAAVNPPPAVTPSLELSVVRSPRLLPIRRHSLRAVIVGADVAGGPWLAAAADALLTGLRIIVEDEGTAPPGIVELARGAGLFVGEKRAR